MYRTLQYALLFLVAALLQIFLFNNLSLSVYLNPLVYVVFIALLPMETTPIRMLLAGLAMGLAMDWTMGAAGVNTIATVFVAFVRIHLLNFVCGKENVHDGGVPSARRLGEKSFTVYLALTVVLHNAIFFYMEALSWSHALLTLLRLGVSAAVGSSIMMIWGSSSIAFMISTICCCATVRLHTGASGSSSMRIMRDSSSVRRRMAGKSRFPPFFRS